MTSTLRRLFQIDGVLNRLLNQAGEAPQIHNPAVLSSIADKMIALIKSINRPITSAAYSESPIDRVTFAKFIDCHCIHDQQTADPSAMVLTEALDNLLSGWTSAKAFHFSGAN